TTANTTSATASSAAATADQRARRESQSDRRGRRSSVRACVCTRRPYIAITAAPAQPRAAGPGERSGEAVRAEQGLQVALERRRGVDVVRTEAQQRRTRAVAELHVHLGLAGVVDEDL